MNGTELVEVISADFGTTRHQADALATASVCKATSSVRAGGAVCVPGFGADELRLRRTREGCHRRTGAAVQVHASK